MGDSTDEGASRDEGAPREEGAPRDEGAWGDGDGDFGDGLGGVTGSVNPPRGGAGGELA